MASYWRLLRLDGALAFCLAAFVARMPMAMYTLGTVLMITALHGSYALAGGLSAAGLAGAAAVMTPVAAWVDRFGPRRVLVPQSAVFFAGTAAFIAAAETHAPVWLMFLTGTAGAASLPALGAMTRAGWSTLCGSDEQRLQLAFALESVNDDLIFILGPALTALLATKVTPAGGIGAAAILSVAGAWLFIAQPCVRSGPAETGPSRSGPHSRRWTLPAPGLVTLAPVLIAFGAATASIELSTVAFATEHGHRSLAGLILAVCAVGSCTGGLWYGSRHWRAPAPQRFAVTQIVSVVVIGMLWLAPGIPALFVLILLAGAVTSPTFINGYSILQQQARPGRDTEALAWVGFSVCMGAAMGSAVTGWSIDAYGARAGYLVAAGWAALAAGACLTGLVAGHFQLVPRHGVRRLALGAGERQSTRP